MQLFSDHRPSACAILALLLLSSSTVATATACWTPPEPRGLGPPETVDRRLGRIGARLITPGCPPGGVVYQGIAVIFENLGACEDRQVDISAMGRPDRDRDGDLVGGLLPDKVRATGSALWVDFSAAEILAARGAPRASELVVELRCGGVVVDADTLEIDEPTPVADVVNAVAVDGLETEIFALRDNGGLFAVTTAVGVAAAGAAPVPLSLQVINAEGLLERRYDDVLQVVGDRFLEMRHASIPARPAIERFGDDRTLVRLFDDVLAPQAGWAALLDDDGAIVRAWNEAVLLAERRGDRLVLVRTPLQGAGEPGAVVVDIVDIVSGETLAADLQTPLGSGDFHSGHPAFVVAVDDDGVDIVHGVNAMNGFTGVLQYTRVRRDAAPVSLPVPLPSPSPTGDGTGASGVAPLPGAGDGRFLVYVGNWLRSHWAIAAVTPGGDAVEFVEDLGTLPDSPLQWTTSRSGGSQAMTMMIGDGANSENEVVGHYLYFRDGAFVCTMRSLRPMRLVTVTDDDFLLVDGEMQTGCDAEHAVHLGRPEARFVETDAGFREVSRGFRSLWVVLGYPLDRLRAVARQSLLD